MRNVIRTGAIVVALLGGAGAASAQVANHGVVSGGERNIEKNFEQGGYDLYAPRGSRLYNYDRTYTHERGPVLAPDERRW